MVQEKQYCHLLAMSFAVWLVPHTANLKQTGEKKNKIVGVQGMGISPQITLGALRPLLGPQESIDFDLSPQEKL